MVRESHQNVVFIQIDTEFKIYEFKISRFHYIYLQVSATFAASLVTSPAIGAYLGTVYSENLVVWLATAIALLDVLFILVFVPESLPEKVRPATWGSPISWDKVDPFSVSLPRAPT